MIAKILTMLLGLTLILAVACGSSPAAPEATTASVTEPTTAPAMGETSQPTATPQVAAPPAEVEVNPGKLTWMIANFGNERFDYIFAAGGGHDYSRIVHGFLISTDLKEGRRVFAPGIATKWEISGDGLTWTLTIREGVKFHDGADVTAEDVLWTLRHELGPQALDYGATQTLNHIMDRIEQTGPNQVSVTTKVPATELPERISDASGVWLGLVLPKRATLHDEKEEAAYDRNPIGAGPMRLVGHTQAQVMKFERFDDFYHQPKNGFDTDKRVNFTELDLFLVPEESTRVAALRSGEADIAPISIPSREQVEAGGGRVIFGKEGVVFRIEMPGCWKPQFPCHDQRVRQALNYAIDKELMRDQLYGGPEVMQVKGWSYATPSTIGYSPDLDPFPYDPDKARQLLSDAGYPGGEGFGKLVINTRVSPSLPLLPESAQLAADMWRRELGLDVEVIVGDKAAYNKILNFTEDFYGQIAWQDNETRIDAVGIVKNSYGNPDRHRRAHNDPELFALTQKTMAILDPVEQEKALNSTYQRLRDEAYEIWLGYLNIPWGVGPRIQTWEPYPLAFYPSALHTITLN